MTTSISIANKERIIDMMMRFKNNGVLNEPTLTGT